MASDPNGAPADGDESDRVHARIQTILRGGLGISVALLLAGAVVRLASGARDAPSVQLFALTASGDLGLTLLALGILVLALTPALRVFALLVLWWRERDLPFVAIAIFVIATLGVSLALGKAG